MKTKTPKPFVQSEADLIRFKLAEIIGYLSKLEALTPDPVVKLAIKKCRGTLDYGGRLLVEISK